MSTICLLCVLQFHIYSIILHININSNGRMSVCASECATRTHMNVSSFRQCGFVRRIQNHFVYPKCEWSHMRIVWRSSVSDAPITRRWRSRRVNGHATSNLQAKKNTRNAIRFCLHFMHELWEISNSN